MYPNWLSGNILRSVSVLRMMKGNGIFKKREEIIVIKRDSYLEHKTVGITLQSFVRMWFALDKWMKRITIYLREKLVFIHSPFMRVLARYFIMAIPKVLHQEFSYWGFKI